ncbi:proprotein convertase subtilisin/kexin type 5-like [Branchiostoma lanceolatum]|uniref:proprotein convertase subtilisin/kexin type 5-like n=1 Tax=Branchiostoma lanceolatum TaxID=7740 RepID=UPI003455E5A1
MDETPADGTVTCVADCPLTHFNDDGVCKRCSSLCSDVSGDGRVVCTGPAADQCTVCVYTASDGSCFEGCNPGQRTIKNVCGIPGYVLFNEVCYKYFEEEKTYDEARQTCDVDGGIVAVPKDSQTNTFIHELGGTMKRWIGLTDIDDEDQWVFADGQSLTSSSYENWNTDEPNNGNVDPDEVGEDCVEVSGSSHNWNDIGCHNIDTFVCQIDYTPSAVVTLTCEPCQPGYKCVNGDEVEEICPAGTYSRADGTACDPCAVGEFGSSGSSTCQLCPAGEFSTQAEASRCEPCPAGQYSSSEGSTSCKVCTAGQYSSSDSSACQPCPAGQFNTQSGSSSCDNCPAGQYSQSEGSTSCQDCPAGKYSLRSGSSVCWLCPAGWFNTQSGSDSCDSCPAGQHSPSIGSTSCQVCPAGTYSSSGSRDCTNCPAGQYSDTDGSTGCLDCPTGFTSTAGATSCNSCAFSGYIYSNGRCYKDFAEKNTYSEAQQTCAADSARLAMPKDSPTNTFIAGLGAGEDRWIGLTDIDNEDQWEFADGQSLDSSGYKNWNNNPQEPNGGTSENCAEVLGSSHKWNDESCDSSRGFVCQIG